MTVLDETFSGKYMHSVYHREISQKRTGREKVQSGQGT